MQENNSISLKSAISLCLKALFRNFKLRNVFTISNLFKLLFLYSFSIIWIIVIDIDYSKNFWSKLLSNKLSKHRVSIYSVKDRVGEKTLYYRMLSSLDQSDIDYSGMLFTEELTHFWLTKHFYITATSIINYLAKPDFSIALTHHVTIIPYGYNVTYLNMPSSALYDPNGGFFPKWKHLAQYDVFADIYTFVHGSNPYLEKIIETEQLKNKKIIPTYLAQNFLEYSDSTINTAIVTGTLWGCGRDSLRIALALKNLANENLLVAYGVKDYFKFLGNSYKGMFEEVGNILTSMPKIQKQYGIVLLIHNLEHSLDAIPTSRISEGAASNTLIISDRHKFIEKVFGDNVLYFDALGSNEEIYQQIKKHILWARKNKVAAAQKAKNVYDIFSKNYTIERQFKTLMDNILSSR